MQVTPGLGLRKPDPVDAFGPVDFNANADQLERVVAGPVFNVKGFGAKGDGITDDTVAIMAAVLAATLIGGGIVYFPAGVYLISQTIVVSKGIHFEGPSRSEDTAASSGSGTGLATIKWKTGSGAHPMITFTSATAGQGIFGGGVRRLVLHGNHEASHGVLASSTCQQTFDELDISRVTVAGIQFDVAVGGYLGQNNDVDNYLFIYGSLPAAAAAHGIVIDGGTSGQTTQHHIGAIAGLVYNGYLLYVRASDNNHAQRVHAARQAGGTGGAVRFANGPGVYHGRKTDILYCVGPVYAESSTYGNTIHLLDSETSSVTIDAGGQLNYTVRDYNGNGRLWRTASYKMQDRVLLGAGDFVNGAGSSTTLVRAGSLWAAIQFAKATGSSDAEANVLAPYEWEAGTVASITLVFTTDAAGSSSQMQMRVRMTTVASGDSIATPELDESFQMPVNDLALRKSEVTHTFAVPLGFVKGDVIFLNVRRDAGDANDTSTANLDLLGVKLDYAATGPTSGGSGPWATSTL